MVFDFSKKVALVTGPAGNLGSAVVKAFLNAGASLILIDRKEDRLAEMFPELVDQPEHLLISSIDLLDFSALQAGVKQAADQLGRIDILVHTVGGFRMGEPVHETDVKTWELMLDLNARTLLYTAKAVVPVMIQQQSGKIITVGAGPSLEGKAKMGSYSAAKAAVLRLTESISAELKPQGINANCLLPGTINTPENKQAMPNADHSKWVDPESIAEVILFLSSQQADDIHGAAVPVYGG